MAAQIVDQSHEVRHISFIYRRRWVVTLAVETSEYRVKGAKSPKPIAHYISGEPSHDIRQNSKTGEHCAGL
ncbi:MAG: hypothetical protein ACPHE1_07615, partial [Pseudomonadales bacterium]